METIILSSEPLPETESTVTLDFFDPVRGPQSERFGKITLDPTASQIYLLSSSAEQDLYLLRIPFTLQRAPDTKYSYKEITFEIQTGAREARAMDFFPRSVTSNVTGETYVTVADNLTITQIEKSDQVNLRFCFTDLHPTITAYGEGEYIFSWLYDSASTQTGVKDGTKHVLFILQTPHGTPSVSASIWAETVIGKPSYRGWELHDKKTDDYEAHWNLTEAKPFFPPRTEPISPPSSPLQPDSKRNSPKIDWKDCQPEQLVLHLSVGQEAIEANTPLQDLMVNELRDLLGRLFPNAETILAEPLTPGKSGTGVLKIQPFFDGRGGGQWVVVKFGAISAIQQEYTNYTEYVQYFIKNEHKTVVHNHEQTDHLGGIVYSFVGTDIQETQDFEVYYQQKDFSEVQRVLDNLFLHTCGLWYANHSRLESRNLTEDYQQPDSDTLEKRERAAAEHLPSVQFRHILTFKSLKKTPARRFSNPFRVLNPAQPLVRTTYVSTTHGDLNPHNILVDPVGYPWLIDFQNTRPSHILRDAATLDAVVRFQLLSAQQATLEEFLSMEEALCTPKRFSQLKDLQTSYTTDNPALAKVYQTVLHLRTLACWMVERNPEDDMSEYYIALLYVALDTLQYFSLESEQRERALLSVSLLIDVLGD